MGSPAMDPNIKNSVDIDVVFPDALPKPDETARIVSKESTPGVKPSGASSVQETTSEKAVAPSTGPKEMELEFARVIEAELVKPGKGDENDDGDNSKVDATSAHQEATDEPIILAIATVTDPSDERNPLEEDKSAMDEDQDPSTDGLENGGEEPQGGLFSQDDDEQPKTDSKVADTPPSSTVQTNDTQQEKESKPASVDNDNQGNHPEPVSETEEADKSSVAVPMIVHFNSHVETMEASQPLSAAKAATSQDGPLSDNDLAQSLSLASKGNILSDGMLTSISSSASSPSHTSSLAVRAELFHLLMLILLLCGGMGVVLVLSLPRTRRYLLWPVRHWFYAKLPQEECETSLERVMLHELGEDLIMD
ncbi:hypothetical protein BGW41_001180 [Actinomortierella wolfii]|nr:hypothetical protein BGW41_001180 [Actinomortierella wolfii]